MSEPRWIGWALVPAIHERLLSEHGGTAGLRDPAALDSALARPRSLWAYEPATSLERLAAAYAFGLAWSRPSIDGNKRVALVVCEVFLKDNGRTLTAPQGDKYLAMVGLASETIGEQEFEQWLSNHCIR